MDIPEWAQRLLSVISPNGVVTTLVVFALTLAFHVYRTQAARRQVRALDGRLRLLAAQNSNLEAERANLER